MWKKATSLFLLSLFLCVAFGSGFRADPMPPAPPKTTGVFELGNDWYDANNSYIKLKVWEEGIYRVSASDLAANGFSLSGVAAQNLHLIYRGEEQYIHVAETAGSVDYIEFYGERNDGQVDSLMYRQPISGLAGTDEIPNIHLSAFTDTAAYFLTFDNNPGLRYQPFFDSNYSNYTPETYFRYESYHEFHPSLNNNSVSWNKAGGAQYNPFHILNSYWVTAEGYVGRGFIYGIRTGINVPTPFAANLGNPNDIECRVFGKSSLEHILTVDVDNNVIYSDTTSDVYVQTRTLTHNGALGNTTQIGLLASGRDNNTDNNHYCYSKIRYDRLFDMDNDSTIKMVQRLEPALGYIQFQNCPGNSEGYIYDLVEHTRIRATVNNGNLDAIIPGSPSSRNLFVASDVGIKTPLIAQPSLANLSDASAGAQFVIITHRSLSNSAEAYKMYRDTNTVNTLSAKVVYVDEIYDEFSYGSIHPWGIKRFCKNAIDNWTITPEFFLLWGKGQYRTRSAPKNLVPTPCYPASDYEYVSDFDPMANDIVPEVPIGRVNCETEAEGFAYLDKVNTYEHTPWQPWMKESVFLGGGDNTNEQTPILNFLRDNYGPVVANPPAGGNYSYYQKFNTGEITNSTVTSTDRINAGTNIIHFFGHSSSNIYDVDIKEPVLYQNFGKFPLMVAFGCFGGDFVGDGKSFGERFVLEPERGSIGYLANSTAGLLTPLGNYGNYLYPAIFDEHYGEPIGVAIQKAHQDYWNGSGGQTIINHAKQMNLQGDPSIHLYSAAKPDLEISESSIFFEPENFSAADSAFEIKVIARNLGRVTQDSFYFSLRQRVPSANSWITYPSIHRGPITNQDTISILINNTMGSEMAGLNSFDIFIDSTDVLDEYSESNNRVLFDYVIPGNVPAILYPYDYAVIEDNQVTLSASAFVMGTTEGIPYLFEIDTTPTFNSPAYVASPTRIGTSNYVAWDVPYALTDSMVYYWRVRLRDILPANWASASFKYIPTKVGWAQSRPPQFFKDPTFQIEMDKVNRNWNFESYAVELHAFVNQGDHGNYRLANGAFSSIFPSANFTGILHTSIRGKDLIPAIQGTPFGDWFYSVMPDNDGAVASDMLSTADGDYFLAVSEGNPRGHLWSNQLISAFGVMGADTNKLRNLQSGESFIFFGKKGSPQQGITITEPNIYDPISNTYKLDLRKALETNFADGKIISTSVGPAAEWTDMIWDWSSVDLFPDESMQVEVYALRPDNSDSLVYSGLPLGSHSLAGIDADRFPFLRLEALVEDSIQLTAPQLDHWHVLYNPAPDVLIDPTESWVFDRDSVQLGESISVDFMVRNISDYDMDSLLVRFTVRDAERSPIFTSTQRYNPFAALQNQVLNHTFSTAGFTSTGSMTFTIELNPDNDQPEQYQFNNFFEHPFFVGDDGINPILDVTVDGKHLMTGDIVSPLPEILIEINDENPFLAVSDTAFEVYFGPKTPNSANLPRVFIDGNPQMEVTPAQLPENKVRLSYRPGPLEDGEYTLRVMGYDQAGNASGKVAYEIDFLVVNASSLSEVLNYPNPFSTSTRFVYTLTGAEVPEQFELHIYTMSGKMVKIIDLAGMDDIQIGRNITDYAWDGRDEFGDLLANGVYIYKVVAKLNGDNLDFRDEGGPQTMKNGFGKLYIMR